MEGTETQDATTQLHRYPEAPEAQNKVKVFIARLAVELVKYNFQFSMQ